jgi:WD40 repeat protein
MMIHLGKAIRDNVGLSNGGLEKKPIKTRLSVSVACLLLMFQTFAYASLKSPTLVPIAFSKDGRILATVGPKVIRVLGLELARGRGRQTVELWDPTAGRKFLTLYSPEYNIYSLSFLPDDKTLACIGSRGTVSLLDMLSRKTIKRVTWHDGMWPIAFSPINAMVAFASGNNRRVIKVLDIESGKVVHTFQGHIGTVRSLSFSPDGTLLASGSDDSSIRIWDVALGNGIKTLTGHSGSVTVLVFSSNGKMLASGSFETKLWDVSSGGDVCTFPAEIKYFWALAISPSGALVATGDSDSYVRIWDVATGKEKKRLPSSIKEGHFFSILFSPDGRTLAASRYIAGTTQLWDLDSGQELRIWNIAD